jgi:eukaryotic-like serine/threonine-protein kinase
VTALRLQPGHVLAGKYSVRALLGYGGATASYAAVLASGRPVVLKLFSPQLADRGDVLGALQRAAGVTNALPADATAPILDVGFDPQTRSPFTATEQMPVPSLLDTVRAGPLPPADVALVLRGVALAVDAAHAQGLAHGGLKPQNVFVGPPTPAGHRMVKVIDFGVGIARATLPTDEGRWMAAPWLAPEQLQGGPEGPAVDVFSAGLLAFFAATGRPYWRSCQAPTPDLAGWQQEIAAVRVPPSVRARELGVAFPVGWDMVLARALAPNPRERFGSVAELSNALAVMAQGAAVPVAAPVAQPVQPAQPLQAPVMIQPVEAAALPVEGPPRSRAGLWIGLTIGALVLVGGGIALALTLRKPPALPVANAPPPSASAPVATASATGAAPSVAVAPESPPDAGAAAAATDTPIEAAAPEPAQLTVVCTPDCDTITIDDEVLDAGLADPQSLQAGVHTVIVAKATYLSQTRKVTLKAGQKEKASFFLSRPGPAPAPTKQCGKFLERCP